MKIFILALLLPLLLILPAQSEVVERGGYKVKVLGRDAVKLVPKKWSSCNVLAPEDWTVTGSEQPVGIGIDIQPPESTARASYGILGLPADPWYGTQSPEMFFQTLVTGNGVTGFQYESVEAMLQDGYKLRYWRGYYLGQPVRGFAHYRVFPSMVAGTYIIAARLGFTEDARWERDRNLLYDVASSGRCFKHFTPPSPETKSGAAPEKRRGGSSKDLSVLREEATMGFENVYSPSTGEHTEAPLSSYNATGPNGPGYYLLRGNELEKQELGFGDD